MDSTNLGQVLVVPKDFDEPIVQNGFGAAIGRLSFGVWWECDQSSLNITIERHLQVDNFAKLAEMIVEYGDVVEAAGNLFHFQTAVGRIETASTKTIVIEITLFDNVAILFTSVNEWVYELKNRNV